MKGVKVFKNSDVHAIGVTAMYLATKYEDVYPFNSQIAYEKISHKAVSQSEILHMESNFLHTFDFGLELVTPFDFHEYFFGLLLTSSFDLLPSLQELSLLLIRMAL
jgi:hypothetical protein